ncbi:MAG: protein kinase [Isosphaeraceae bacterium]|nr:protein kinase [Isosphaeraceae bacterium]
MQIDALAEAWSRGEPIDVREILDARDSIDSESALRIIYEDLCLRRESGLPIDEFEWESRFPEWAADLRALLECDRWIRPELEPIVFPEPGEILGGFRLIEELGRGASGRTFLAIDPSLADRPVVVKVVADDHDEHLALARLRHTHIVPLFSQHTLPERRLRILCMPYLGGAGLSQILDDLAVCPESERSGAAILRALDRLTRPWPAPPAPEGPFRRRLEQATYSDAVVWMIACLAEAVHYAHVHSLVHMDIKPSNVLLTVDGRPLLLDFHLARGEIASGELVFDRLGGTRGWMSPEQLDALAAAREGKPVPRGVDRTADIYALGLLLRHALSPRRESSPNDAPKGFTRSTGLGDIIEKCLEPNASDRYPDASALAADLRRHLNNEPLFGVANRDPSERLVKWLRRNPATPAWATAVLVLGLAVVGISAYLENRNEEIDRSIGIARNLRDVGRLRESNVLLESLRASAARLPLAREPIHRIREELESNHRAEAAEELHRLAEMLRDRHGASLPAGEQGARLLADCVSARRSWERFSASNDETDNASITEDLLELILFCHDLRASMSTRPMKPSTLETLRDDLSAAERIRGSSLSVRLRREAFTPSPGPMGSAKPSPRTASEFEDLGRFELRREDLRSARRYFQAATEIDPSRFRSHFYLAECHYRLADPASAAAEYATCLAIRPTSALLHFNRALCLESSADAASARRAYDRAIEIDPTLAHARLNRARLSILQSDFPAARRDLELAIDHADEHLRGRIEYNLAVVLERLGEPALAFDHAQRADRLGSEEARALLDRLRAARSAAPTSRSPIPTAPNTGPAEESPRIRLSG